MTSQHRQTLKVTRVTSAALLLGSGLAWGQDITPRMSYLESATIKCEMLGGRITGRDQDSGRYLCSAPGMAEVELDHIVPLCLHGPNDRNNLQLQPWPEAKRKDALEGELCGKVRRGELSRPEAVAIIKAWRP